MSGRTYRDRVTVGTRSIYPVAGNPDGVVTGEAGDIGIDPGGKVYECAGSTDWDGTSTVKDVADVATAEAITGSSEGRMIYVTSTQTYYIWRGNPSIARDGTGVLDTGDAGTTRWCGISGQYIGQPTNQFSKFISVEGVQYPYPVYADAAAAATGSGTDGSRCYVTSANTTYRYVAAGAGYTVDGLYVLATFDAGNTRWIGVEGQYIGESTNFGQKVLGNSSLQGQSIQKQSVEQASFLAEAGDATYVLDGSLAVVDATLPAAGDEEGEIFTFIITNIDNQVRILPLAFGDTINELDSYIPRIVPSVVSLCSDGTNNWDIVFRGYDPARERQRESREVAVSGGNTVQAQGTLELNYRLVELYVKCVVACTGAGGNYTLAAERISDSQDMLAASPYDLTAAGGFPDNVWTSIPLGTTSNTTMAGLDSYMLSFISDNAALDAEGVMWIAVLEIVN